ncbi:hypothetical protein B4144_1065 [Bacillus atrophaeus]|nr:hypothetical protein B4144_1065 [Bacillus atrophaeus]
MLSSAKLFLPSNNMLVIYCEGLKEYNMQTVYQRNGLHRRLFTHFLAGISS